VNACYVISLSIFLISHWTTREYNLTVDCLDLRFA
jgi:hypothetical protein